MDVAAVDNPELSRRLAGALFFGDPSPDMRRRIRVAAASVSTFEELPEEVRQWVLDAEAGIPRPQG